METCPLVGGSTNSSWVSDPRHDVLGIGIDAIGTEHQPLTPARPLSGPENDDDVPLQESRRDKIGPMDPRIV